jgi:proline dehydrogenase
MYATPPKYDFDEDDEEHCGFRMPAETPAPHRARVNNLENQVNELVRNKMHTEKRHKADISKYMNDMDTINKELEKVKAESKMRARELERCKAEGDGMREEVSFGRGA